jgi:hypothetical protein
LNAFAFELFHSPSEKKESSGSAGDSTGGRDGQGGGHPGHFPDRIDHQIGLPVYRSMMAAIGTYTLPPAVRSRRQEILLFFFATQRTMTQVRQARLAEWNFEQSKGTQSSRSATATEARVAMELRNRVF